MLYFETVLGKIISEHDVLHAISVVYGPTHSALSDDEIRQYAKECRGIKNEVDAPDVEQLVRGGRKFQAIKIYYETHRCSLSEAREYVEALVEKLNDEINSDLTTVQNNFDSQE